VRAALENAPHDPHVQVALDLCFDATRSVPQLATSLAAQIINVIGNNRKAARPVKLWATHWPSNELGTTAWIEHGQRQNAQEPQAPVTYPPMFETPAHLYPGGARQSAPRWYRTPAAQQRLVELTTAANGNGTPSMDPFVSALLAGDSRYANALTPSRSSSRAWQMNVTHQPLEQVFEPSQVIYLCPESPNVLWEVVPTLPNGDGTSAGRACVYAIGGLVDRSVVRGVSMARAEAAGFATARLPIVESIGQVGKAASLNVDTVFQCLLDWSATHYARQQERLNAGGDLSRTLPPLSREEQLQLWAEVFHRRVPIRYFKGLGRDVPAGVRTVQLERQAAMAATSPLEQGDSVSPSAADVSTWHARQQYTRKQEWRTYFQRARLPFVPKHIVIPRAQRRSSSNAPSASSTL
jgi:hypothetical protein